MYVFRTAWTSKNVSAGLASGGDEVFFSGAGFDAAENYSCVFSVGGYSGFSCVEVLSDEEATCVTPLWNFAAAVASVHLVATPSFQEALRVSTDASQRFFTFGESVITLTTPYSLPPTP